MSTKQNMLDKAFHTYSLKVDKKHTVAGISQDINLMQYLQQLINYAKSQQRQMNTTQGVGQNQYQQTRRF